ncbi:MAG: hypothetical protein ACXWLS_07135 [Myxococcaceae bacterium]
MLHPTGFALKTLQVLGSGGVAGVLGGFASHTAWVGICFGVAGILAALTFMDCRCACVKPGSDCAEHPSGLPTGRPLESPVQAGGARDSGQLPFRLVAVAFSCR